MEYNKKYSTKKNFTEEEKNKMKGFPVHFFEIIDREKVDITKLNYIPDGNDTGNLMFETYFDRPRLIAPYAGGYGKDADLQGIIRKEIYKYKDELFGIHFRGRAYYRKTLYDDFFQQCQEYVLNLNMDEIKELIEADYFGDGSWPGYVRPGWKKYQ